MISCRLLVIPLVAAWLAGCTVPAKPLPVPAQTLRTSIRTVCITQLTVDVPVSQHEQRIPAFLEQMRSALAGAGFQVPEVAQVAAVKTRVFKGAGPIWDPEMGTRDDAAFARAQSAWFAAARDELGCDAMATGRIAVVTSHIYAGIAKWDGIEESVPGTDFGTGGPVAALSFWLTLADMQQREIYFNTGGIQLLVDFKRDSLLWAPEAELTASENVLAYEEKNRRAIRASLDSFLEPGASRASW